MNSFIIKPDGTTLAYNPSNGANFSLKEMQSAVGGFIEVINLPNGRIMIVNEDGKLQKLPINKHAMNILGGDFPDFIVGTVLVCPTSMCR